MVTAGNGLKSARGQGWLGAAAGHVAVAVAYAACYVLLRNVSVSHWSLQAGLRVLCLALMPYRYWPALVVGEVLPLGWQGWENHARFGSLWACLLTIPPMLLSAPLFAACRRRMAVLSGGELNMSALLTYILIGAVVTALANTATLAMVRLPSGEPAPAITMHIVLTYFLGAYLGALTVAPSVLALWLGRRGQGGRLLDSAFLRSALTAVLPSLLLLVWLAAAGRGAELTEIARMAMFLPVGWMALQHGWRGAAVAGTLASVAVELTVNVVRDPAVIQAQALIAFAMTSLLMLGARLPRAGDARVADTAGEQEQALRGFKLAQQGLYQEEQRLREVAESLEHLAHSMRDGHQRMFERLRPLLPVNVEQSYARHIDHAQREVHRLADTLHPRAWRERGLVATFEDGPLAKAAALAGARYGCEMGGGGLEQLSPDVHLTLYRQACEMLVYLMACEPVRDVRVQIRGGLTQGQRWVVLRMSGARATPSQRGKPAPEWRQLVALLGTNGQGLATIRERAQIYGGVARERHDDRRLSVSVLLHDAWRGESPELMFVSGRPVSA
jgi:glucose-6-phosphate-specific signal transduction histidine kinase